MRDVYDRSRRNRSLHCTVVLIPDDDEDGVDSQVAYYLNTNLLLMNRMGLEGNVHVHEYPVTSHGKIHFFKRKRYM